MLNNAFALGVAWAVVAYSFYFIEFYMKYVPVSSIQMLAIVMGVSDFVSCMVFTTLMKYYST